MYRTRLSKPSLDAWVRTPDIIRIAALILQLKGNLAKRRQHADTERTGVYLKSLAERHYLEWQTTWTVGKGGITLLVFTVLAILSIGLSKTTRATRSGMVLIICTTASICHDLPGRRRTFWRHQQQAGAHITIGRSRFCGIVPFVLHNHASHHFCIGVGWFGTDRDKGAFGIHPHATTNKFGHSPWILRIRSRVDNDRGVLERFHNVHNVYLYHKITETLGAQNYLVGISPV